jgi:murein DD-endopeptidase MepM/ murein hydrolase activator NlpD
MEEKERKKGGLLTLLSDTVQLRFYRSENFEQIGSFELSPRSIYILFSSVILVLLLLVFSLLAFTPLQRLIPRLSSIENSRKFVQLSETLDDIDASLQSQEVYLSALRTIVSSVGEIDMSNIDLPDIDMTSIRKDAKPKVATNQSAIVIANKNTQISGVEAGSIFDEMESADFMAPLAGLISADFDPQKKHLGVDIIAPANTAVKAIKDGYIIIADWSLDTGHTIGIQHDHNILSFYKHNSVLLKEKGNFVKAGEIIAIIGNSGKLTSGPHLHFEMWHRGKPVNPNDYINLK